MVLQAFILLCSLAAICFSAAPARYSLPCWAAAFVLMLLLSNPAALGLGADLAIFYIESSQAALLIALMALSCLMTTNTKPVSSVFGGVASAFWLTGLLGSGFPAWLVMPVTVLFPILAMQLGQKRPGFYSPRLRDEALVMVLLAALIMALAPEISRGWLSSSIPGSTDVGNAHTESVWIPLIVAAISAVLGAFYRVYANRKRSSR